MEWGYLSANDRRPTGGLRAGWPMLKRMFLKVSYIGNIFYTFVKPSWLVYLDCDFTRVDPSVSVEAWVLLNWNEFLVTGCPPS